MDSRQRGHLSKLHRRTELARQRTLIGVVHDVGVSTVTERVYTANVRVCRRF